MGIGHTLHSLITEAGYLERRIDPYFRGPFDALLQEPLGALVQVLMRHTHGRQGLALGQERAVPDEEGITRQLIEQMTAFTHQHYPHGGAERLGNTKTYGVVRAGFEVLPDLPEELRHGIFARPERYRAYVRFAGPGPLSPPDMKDAGIMSIGIKVMGVEGEKLLEDEEHTQDFTGISAPTFTTPNIVENLKLQKQLVKDTPLFYFINPFDSHYLDLIMQGLYAKVQSSPLEARYWSCVPYRLGDDQAMQYSVRPRSREQSKVPRQPSDNYLREAMAKTLGQKEVTFDFMVQLQTDPERMPIEDASIRWPEGMSPYRPVAILRIPVQKFDSPGQLAFAGNLSINPWHSLAAHRPLGNQNRARRRMYYEMAQLRQSINRQPHIEPTGDEVFE